MCGITALLSCTCCTASISADAALKSLEPALRRRGPDAFGERAVTLPAESGNSIRFNAAVLHFRGAQPYPQPAYNGLGDVLCWNGQIWGGIPVRSGESDTHTLLSRLGDSRGDFSQTCALFSSIRGPHAFIYWNDLRGELLFGRDPLGRRSLCTQRVWHRGGGSACEAGAILVSSLAMTPPAAVTTDEAAIASESREEVIPRGIYRLSCVPASDGECPPHVDGNNTATREGGALLWRRRLCSGRFLQLDLFAWPLGRFVNDGGGGDGCSLSHPLPLFRSLTASSRSLTPRAAALASLALLSALSRSVRRRVEGVQTAAEAARAQCRGTQSSLNFDTLARGLCGTTMTEQQLQQPLLQHQQQSLIIHQQLPHMTTASFSARHQQLFRLAVQRIDIAAAADASAAAVIGPRINLSVSGLLRRMQRLLFYSHGSLETDRMRAGHSDDDILTVHAASTTASSADYESHIFDPDALPCNALRFLRQALLSHSDPKSHVASAPVLPQASVSSSPSTCDTDSAINGCNDHPAPSLAPVSLEGHPSTSLVTPLPATAAAAAANTSHASGASVAVMFSGGLDSMVVARLAHEHTQPPHAPIDLINVCFAGRYNDDDDEHASSVGASATAAVAATATAAALQHGGGGGAAVSPDRLAAIAGWRELVATCPSRPWQLICVDEDHGSALASFHRLASTLAPRDSHMDFNIGAALWYAARGIGYVYVEQHTQKQKAECASYAQSSSGGSEEGGVGFSFSCPGGSDVASPFVAHCASFRPIENTAAEAGAAMTETRHAQRSSAATATAAGKQRAHLRYAATAAATTAATYHRDAAAAAAADADTARDRGGGVGIAAMRDRVSASPVLSTPAINVVSDHVSSRSAPAVSASGAAAPACTVAASIGQSSSVPSARLVGPHRRDDGVFNLSVFTPSYMTSTKGGGGGGKKKRAAQRESQRVDVDALASSFDVRAYANGQEICSALRPPVPQPPDNNPMDDGVRLLQCGPSLQWDSPLCDELVECIRAYDAEYAISGSTTGMATATAAAVSGDDRGPLYCSTPEPSCDADAPPPPTPAPVGTRRVAGGGGGAPAADAHDVDSRSPPLPAPVEETSTEAAPVDETSAAAAMPRKPQWSGRHKPCAGVDEEASGGRCSSNASHKCPRRMCKACCLAATRSFSVRTPQLSVASSSSYPVSSAADDTMALSSYPVTGAAHDAMALSSYPVTGAAVRVPQPSPALLPVCKVHWESDAVDADTTVNAALHFPSSCATILTSAASPSTECTFAPITLASGPVSTAPAAVRMSGCSVAPFSTSFTSAVASAAAVTTAASPSATPSATLAAGTPLLYRVLVRSSARVLLSGIGADEQLAGYGRHRTAFSSAGDEGPTIICSRNAASDAAAVVDRPTSTSPAAAAAAAADCASAAPAPSDGGWTRLAAELRHDCARLHYRNLGRDDRVCGDSGRELRAPFLDESVVALLRWQLPLPLLCDLCEPYGVGDKRILRDAARLAGLGASAGLVKRAIHFGSGIAKAANRAAFGSNRAANRKGAGALRWGE